MSVRPRRNPLVRILLFLGVAAIAVVGYLFLLNVLSGRLGSFSSAVPAVLLASAALVINWRFFATDGGSLADVGFDKPALRVGQAIAGFIAGLLTVAAWILVLHQVGHVAWRAAPSVGAPGAAGALIFIVFNNLAEELVYRSYLFVVLMRTYGASVAVVATSVLFTLLHVQAGIPWPNALAGVLTSALVFAALFLRWRSVPLVFAFHAGMNVAQEALGLRSSGLTIFVPQVEAAIPLDVLAWAAAINLCVAGAVLLSARRSGRANRGLA